MGRCGTRACDHAGVFASISALFLSAAAATIGLVGGHGAFQAVGKKAEPLKYLVQSLALNYSVILGVNLASVAAIWLSFFHCERLDGPAMHLLTSSRSLCWLQILGFVTFLLQLVMAQLMMALYCVAIFMGYLCRCGLGVIDTAQGLANELAGAHHGKGFNLQRHCNHLAEGNADGEADGAWCVWLGCFLTTVSQALMAGALNGEKERASVHEAKEGAGLSGHVAVASSGVHAAGSELRGLLAPSGSSRGSAAGSIDGGNIGSRVGSSAGAAAGYLRDREVSARKSVLQMEPGARSDLQAAASQARQVLPRR